ncbi:hypothetical protein NB713_003881 [Xanthomonas sacchari]|nr:hypothetical protein [Xanthomonas sacchari]
MKVPLPRAASRPLLPLVALAAVSVRSLPATTWAALVSTPVARRSMVDAACTRPPRARSPVLVIASVVPASTVPWLSMAAPFNCSAPALCSTLWLPLRRVPPACRVASRPALTLPFTCRSRCACACSSCVVASCPPSDRSRPARRSSACALSVPACSRSPCACALSPVAAATVPPNVRSLWLVSVTWPLWLPSWPVLAMRAASSCRSRLAISSPWLSMAPLARRLSVSPA